LLVGAGSLDGEMTPAKTAKKKIVVTKKTVPSLEIERELWAEGAEFIVGVDEVGRGAWAGPLSVGAAVLPQDKRVNNIRDSKMLTEPERERLFDKVADWCVTWSVGHAEQWECDAYGMAEAQRIAARRAIQGLGVTPHHVLIDGNWDFVGLGNTQKLIKGDARCLSIAAASVLAKVTRDRRMREAHTSYPLYNFDNNKGYPCPRQKAALRAYGPSAIHRRRWVFMDHLPFGIQPNEEELEADQPVQGELL
jgi:ribonuclease HII